MKYPRIPHDLKQHIKLTVRDIEQIRQLYFSRQITSIKGLAQSFNVAPKTILYWIDPFERQKQLEKRVENLKRQRMREPDFKDRQPQWVKNSQHYHFKIDPTYREYCVVSSAISASRKYPNKKPVPAFRRFMRAIEEQ